MTRKCSSLLFLENVYYFVLFFADSNVDPSLQRAQRQLKKAKLTDELNEKIANRPGPLELVEQHILEAEDPIKTAIQGIPAIQDTTIHFSHPKILAFT